MLPLRRLKADAIVELSSRRSDDTEDGWRTVRKPEGIIGDVSPSLADARQRTEALEAETLDDFRGDVFLLFSGGGGGGEGGEGRRRGCVLQCQILLGSLRFAAHCI